MYKIKLIWTGGAVMIKENMLQDLLQQKRGYESLLAMNSSGKHKSSTVENMLKDHLKRVQRSITNIQHKHS